MQMRPSKVLKKLRAGEVVSCAKINASDPKVVEIACLCGFDCIWLDREHVPNDWSLIESQIYAAKAYGSDVMVRVSRGSYSDLIKPLEADATGIMIPHVMNAKQAHEIVRQTRFHPIGLRPIDGGGSDGAYCMLNISEYIKAANHERFVVVQIEDKEALDDIDEIAALAGIDMLFFGPGDFSQSIGAPGQWDHPKVQEARERVAQVAIKNGKYAGTLCSPAEVNRFIEMGYRFINTAADVVGLGCYFKDALLPFGKSQDKTPGTYA
jgi:4-hydroxy-2-oxoheptanedioate aldolase